jgi:hypothetical protein
MRAAMSLLLLASVAGCKTTPNLGFAVAVTINSSSLTPDELAKVRKLELRVMGAGVQSWLRQYPITSELTSGEARWIWRPEAGAGGTITIAAAALDEAGMAIAFGERSLDLNPPNTVATTVTLSTGTIPDLLPPPDLAPPPKKISDPCSAGKECESTHCVDGVCCASACTTECQACNVPGKVGTCAPVLAGDKPSHGTCPTKSANDPVTPCSFDGKCDGAGACRLYPKDTLCRPSTCIANQYTPPSICDGKGGCINLPQFDCNPFKCKNATGCFEPPCADSTQCSGTNMCDGTGSCGKLNNGRTCTQGTQCNSTFCVDGVCCDSACTGQCEACDADLSKLGQCLPVSGPPHGIGVTRAGCRGNALNGCGGACNGSNRTDCAFPPASQPCVSQSCLNAKLTQAQTCDGMGSCPVMAPIDCPAGSNGTPTCIGAACGLNCSGTFKDCDGLPGNGCEVNLANDSEHCGTCTTNCNAVGQFCQSSACTCGPGKKACGSTCIPTSACCTPVDCGCAKASPFANNSLCPAGRTYAWNCGDVCGTPPMFSHPTYAPCGSFCGPMLVCCPNP